MSYLPHVSKGKGKRKKIYVSKRIFLYSTIRTRIYIAKLENIPSGIISRVPLPPCATVVDDWFLAHMDGRSVVNTTPPVLVVAFEIILMHIIIYFKKIHGH